MSVDPDEARPSVRGSGAEPDGVTDTSPSAGSATGPRGAVGVLDKPPPPTAS